MTRRFNWADYKTTEFEDIDPEKVIAILPTAAIEQHGPHLPVGVDTMIAEGMLAELRAACPDDLDIRILPVQAVGKSNEHLHAPGTLTLSAENALRIWTEIGLSVARAGVRKIIIVNSHGGNLDLISILARELRVQAGMFAVKCQWGNFGAPDGLYSEREVQFGIHGGDRETSLMLHFHPDLVDMGKATDFPSSAESSSVKPIGPISYGWVASDLNPAGTVGESHLATAEKGKMTAKHQILSFIELLREVKKQPMDEFLPKNTHK